MNYYEQLYDINFFSGDSYYVNVNNSKVKILVPGIPDWNSWESSRMNNIEAKEIWEDFKNGKTNYYESILLGKGIPEDEFVLLSLILCEDAYRNFSDKAFYLLNRILYSSRIPDIHLKSIKLQMAWRAFFTIYNTKNPLINIVNHCLNYVNKEFPELSKCLYSDIKVEIPVQNEWDKLKYSIENKKDVEKFYKETISYILELTAANHQVETLFNYSIIIDLLKRLGVKTVFDYGAGIGTFLILANRYGMETTYADLHSETMNYAQKRLKDLNIISKFIELEYTDCIIPQDLECIICTEVMEHVFEPEKVIENFHKSLKLGGILIVSESFNYSERFCTHIPIHKGKGNQKFLDFLKDMGFKQLNIGFNIHPTIHIKL